MTCIVAIGASGGQGLRNLKELLHALPLPIDAIILAVLHRPADRPSWLKDVLGHASKMPVLIAHQDEELEIGTCYIGEPAHHLELLSNAMAGLVAHDPKVHRNRTIDMLFSSVAERAGKAAIGVILSGGLDDGARGLAAIHRAGGTTMTLRTSGHGNPREDSMPETAQAYDGPIDVLGSVQEIAAAIVRRVATGAPTQTEREYEDAGPHARQG